MIEVFKIGCFISESELELILNLDRLSAELGGELNEAYLCLETLNKSDMGNKITEIILSAFKV